MADNSIDNLQIKIESTTTDAQRGLTKLKNSLQKLSEMSDGIAKMNSEGITKLKSMAEGIDSIANAGNNPGLSKAISELRKLAKIDFSNVGAGSEKLAEVADRVSAVSSPTADVVPPTSPTSTVPIEPSVDVETTKVKLKSLKEVATSVFNAIKGGGKAVFSGIGKIASSAFNGAIAAIKKLGSAAKSVFNGIKKFGSFIGGKFTSALGTASKKMSGLVRSMARIALYRAIRFLFSQITAAVKEGTNNIYQYSKAIGGELASSMDRISSSFLYFKNSIGAMVAPLINALAPAIEYVIDKAVALMNVLNQLFAKLSGASTWTKAVKTQTEYAEAAGGAAEAAQSLTAGFDELNVLSDSGGGGGASTPDYGSMFEEVALDSDFASWLDQIKAMIDAGDWAGLGTYLGEKVNELVNSVDWAGVGTKLGSGFQSAFEFLYAFLDTIDFDNIGASVATLLNNAFAQIDWHLVGQTFAKGWTILVDLMYGFVTTFDWSQFGLAIANFINGWFDEIDLTKSIQTIQELLFGLFESLQQAVRNIQWREIGADISNALNSIDWAGLFGELTQTLSDTLVGLLDFACSTVETLDWGKLGRDLWNSLVAIVTNIDYNSIVSLAFELLGAVIGGATALVVELCITIWDALKNGWNSTKAYFDTFIEEAGGNIIQGLWNGIVNALKNVGNWIVEHIFNPFINGFKAAFGIASPSTVMEEQGGFIIQGLWNGINNAWHSIVEFFTEKLEGIKQVCSEAWKSIKTTASTVWGNIKTSLSTTWDNLKTSASTTWSNITSTVSTAWDNVKTKTSTTWSNISSTLSTTWSTVKSNASTTWSNLKSTISTAWSNIQSDSTTKWNNIKSSLTTTWNTMKSTVSTTWSNMKSTIATNWANIKSNTDTTWNTLKSSLSTAWNSIKSTATSVFTSMKSSINSIWDSLSSHISSVVGTIKSVVSGMVSAITSGVNTAKSLLSSAVSAAQSAISSVKSALSSIGSKVSNAVSSAVDWVGDKLGFASGGFPEVGQLFIAREAGAEMVGSIGGRTAVANNDQIVEGIYQGVLAAMQASGSGSSGNFDVRVYLDGKQITAAVEKRQRERGATIYPGGVLNGV